MREFAFQWHNSSAVNILHFERRLIDVPVSGVNSLPCNQSDCDREPETIKKYGLHRIWTEKNGPISENCLVKKVDVKRRQSFVRRKRRKGIKWKRTPSRDINSYVWFMPVLWNWRIAAYCASYLGVSNVAPSFVTWWPRRHVVTVGESRGRR